MPNPKAPRQYRRAAETQSDLDGFLERLRRLGALDSELAEVAEHWDDNDTDDWPEQRRQLVRMNDDELRAALAGVRDEWEEMHPDPRRDAVRAEAEADVARSDAADRLGLSVNKILEWVGDDVVRARAVLDLEGSTADPRKSLVEPLEKLVGTGS